MPGNGHRAPEAAEQWNRSGQATRGSRRAPSRRRRTSAAGWSLADDLPDGLVIADHAGRVAVFNRAAARLTGISPADALGRDVREALPLHDPEEPLLVDR